MGDKTHDQYDAKVSVVVAVYNSERYLRECLNSIVNQTYKNLEIICVNDGSTDSSLQILDEYASSDDRFRIFSKANEGLGGAAARNMGLENATGRYVVVLDSDDFFELDMLELAVEKAEKTGADIVLWGGFEYDSRDDFDRVVPSILNSSVIPDKEVFSYKDIPGGIYQLSQGMAWNKLFRKAFLDIHKIRFQKIKYTDDAYFTFANMVLTERIAVINKPLCHYRVNSGTNQTGGLANYPDSAYLPYFKLKDSLIEWGVYETVKRSFVNCTAAFLRYCYDMIGTIEGFRFLHDAYKQSVFKQLDILRQDKEFFYDERLFLWIQQVLHNDADEIAFLSAKAYGGNNMTGVLRFPFPKDEIPLGGRVVLMGAGVMGKHFFLQNLINEFCNIVLWVEEKDKIDSFAITSFEEMLNIQYDYVLLAYVREDLIKQAERFLWEHNVPKEKVVYGGTVRYKIGTE